MKRFSFLILMIVMSWAYQNAHAQVIARTTNAEFGKVVKVVEVQDASQADLKVFWVEAKEAAVGNDGLWFSTGDMGIVEFLIYEAYHSTEADLKIHVVDQANQAGWVNDSKKHLLAKEE